MTDLSTDPAGFVDLAFLPPRSVRPGLCVSFAASGTLSALWMAKLNSLARNAPSPRSFDRYVPSEPTLQNAIDAVAGWNTSFPPELGLNAGSLATYNDPRILWAIECFGDIKGRRVLELCPLEGGHTSMLDTAGAEVDAIEANQLAFMRCLITKEILQLKRSRFSLGDFMKALEHLHVFPT
jgi:hypothetical protein